MTLFSFSIPEHVPLILSGTKAQTTRIPRKPRKNGAKPYSVGELAQLYYRSRQKASCHNCILIDTPNCRQHRGFDNYCKYHSNFFGESVITTIIHYTNQMLPGMLRTSQDGHEMWMPTFDKLDCGEQVSWAIADGFSSFAEADEWFSTVEYIENGKKCTYGKDWIKKDWDCILWNGQQIARRVA